MNEEIIRKREVPAMPSDIRIQYANEEFNTGEDTEIKDLSEAGVRDIVEKVRNGTYWGLYLCPDEINRVAWACFDPEYLDSDEEAPIMPSDGQSIFPMKCTMRDRELAAKCVEWYIHTLEPYPGMEWLKESW